MSDVGSLNQFWWLNAKWPLTGNEDITGEHFEDLRKFIFIAKHPGCGHYGLSWAGYNPEDEDKLETTIVGSTDTEDPPPHSNISALDYDLGELIIRTSKTKLWSSGEPIKAGCWRTYPDLTSGIVYEALEDMGNLGDENDNKDTPAAGNWRAFTEPLYLDFVNSAIKPFEDVSEFTDDFTMPDVHPAYGKWMGDNTDKESGGWALHWNWDKYSSFNYNSLAKYVDNRRFGPTGDKIRITIDEFAHVFLNRQVKSLGRNPMAVYQNGLTENFSDRPYRLMATPEKDDWIKETITIPIASGALFPNKTKFDEITHNQYFVDGALPFNNPENPWYSKKICDSFQAVIEHIASSNSLHWKVNATYITNWNSVYPDNQWDLAKAECQHYPPVSDEFWGCNGSGFELFLSELGEDYYDWYYDPGYHYVPASIVRMLELGLNDEGEGTPVYSIKQGEPTGTWRKGWGRSFDRVKRVYMRSSEMGEPSDSGDTFQIWDGVDTITPHWSGIHTAETPERDEFDTVIYTSTASTDYSFTVDAGSELKLGRMIRLYNEEDEISQDSMAWISKVTVISGGIVCELSHNTSSLSAGFKIGLNPNICSRHDAKEVLFNVNSSTPHPKFELQWQMLQDAFKVLECCRYFTTTISLEKRGRGFQADTGYNLGDTIDEALAVVKGYVAGLWSGVGDSDWDSSEHFAAFPSAYYGESGVFDIDGIVSESGGGASCSEGRFALKAGDIESSNDPVSANSIIQNAANTHIPCSWWSRQASSPINTIFPCTVDGCTSPVDPHDDYIERTIYGTLAGSLNPNSWTVFSGSKCSPVVTQNPVEYPPQSGFKSCYTDIIFTFPYDYAIIELDYDKIPESVFIDEDLDEQRIGAIEPVGSPEPDTNPPSPRKANIHIKPKLYWVRQEIEYDEEMYWIWSQYISVEASPAEDLENSNPVWYKPLIKTAGSDTPPTQDWGTSPRMIMGSDKGEPWYGIEDFWEVDEQDWVLSKRWNYTGTPSQNIEKTHWTFSVPNAYYTTPYAQIAHAGDKVYINGLFGKTLQTITSASKTTITIANTGTPTAQSNLKIWYVSGYTIENWKDENAYQWTIGAITKDNLDNEGDESDYFAIELPDEWPMEMYLRIKGWSIERYIEELEV